MCDMASLEAVLMGLPAAAKCLHGKVSDQTVADFERQLGLSLPAEYRLFVSKFGCGSIGSLEIFGLGAAPTGIPSLPWFLAQLLKRGVPLPDSVLPFSPLGDGTYAALLCRPEGPFAAGTVMRWTPGVANQRAPEVLASGFAAYMLDLLSRDTVASTT